MLRWFVLAWLLAPLLLAAGLDAAEPPPDDLARLEREFSELRAALDPAVAQLEAFHEDYARKGTLAGREAERERLRAALEAAARRLLDARAELKRRSRELRATLVLEGFFQLGSKGGLAQAAESGRTLAAIEDLYAQFTDHSTRSRAALIGEGLTYERVARADRLRRRLKGAAAGAALLAASAVLLWRRRAARRGEAAGAALSGPR